MNSFGDRPLGPWDHQFNFPTRASLSMAIHRNCRVGRTYQSVRQTQQGTKPPMIWARNEPPLLSREPYRPALPKFKQAVRRLAFDGH